MLNHTLASRANNSHPVAEPNWAQDAWEAAKDALNHYMGNCNYGYNCGAACGPGQKNYGWVYDKRMKYWKDDLDKYCWLHDFCLKNAQKRKIKRNRNNAIYACDNALMNRAQQHHDYWERCCSFCFWCFEGADVVAAKNVARAMWVKIVTRWGYS